MSLFKSSNPEPPSKSVRVIGPTGKQLGIMTMGDAIKMAESEGAELVNIVPIATPPIYRLVARKDYKKIKKNTTT